MSNNLFAICSWKRRFVVRMVDILIILTIIISLFLTIYYGSHTKKEIQNWQYLLFPIISFFSLFIYFVIFPILCKGKTIGCLIFSTKWKIINKHCNVFLCYIKKEIFMWIIFSILNIIFGIILFFVPFTTDLINAIITRDYSSLPILGICISSFIQIFYSFYMIFLVIIFIVNIYSSNKLTFFDEFSGISEINLKKKYGNQ